MSETPAAMAVAASPANGTTPGKGDQAIKKSDKVTSMVNVAATGRIEIYQ